MISLHQYYHFTNMSPTCSAQKKKCPPRVSDPMYMALLHTAYRLLCPIANPAPAVTAASLTAAGSTDPLRKSSLITSKLEQSLWYHDFTTKQK